MVFAFMNKKKYENSIYNLAHDSVEAICFTVKMCRSYRNCSKETVV